MLRALSCAAATFGFIAAWANHAPAAVIGFNDFSGNETLIDFNDNPAPSATTSLTIGGISFSTFDPGIQITTQYDSSSLFDNVTGASEGHGGQIAIYTGDANEAMRVSFVSVVHRAGILLSTISSDPQVKSWTVSVYDSGDNQLDTGTFAQPASGDAVFAGFETAGAIAYMDIVDAQPHSEEGVGNFQTYFDDLRFEAVPEPGTLALLGLGGLLLVPRRARDH